MLVFNSKHKDRYMLGIYLDFTRQWLFGVIYDILLFYAFIHFLCAIFCENNKQTACFVKIYWTFIIRGPDNAGKTRKVEHSKMLPASYS